jgi:uncharacterized protein YxeA
MKKQIIIYIAIVTVFVSILCGCTSQNTNNQNSNAEDDIQQESYNVKILDYEGSAEEGSDDQHFNDVCTVKVYNEGKAVYATIHYVLRESFGGGEYGESWEKEQSVFLEAGEYKELTFVFKDLEHGQSYSPEVWVDY